MFFTEIFYARIILGELFHAILWSLLFVIAFIVAVVQGNWTLVGELLLITVPGAVIGYLLWRLARWVLLRGEPEQLSLDDLCAQGREISERAQNGHEWFSPADVPRRRVTTAAGNGPGDRWPVSFR